MISPSDFLAQLGEAQLREAAITSLGELHQQKPTRTMFKYGEFVGRCVRLALPRLNGPELTALARRLTDLQAEMLEPPAGAPDEHPDNNALLSLLWRLAGEGIVYPRLREHRDGFVASVEYVALTPRGRRVVAGEHDHPLRPGFLSRLRARAPKMSDDVLERLADAASCLEHGLLRATVVMIGLAVEETVAEAHEALVNSATIQASRARNARDKIAELRAAISAWPNVDERHRLQISLVALENVRTERNRASHPGERFEDAATVEELLVSSSRQLPIISELLLP